jgi:hypothetical protein
MAKDCISEANKLYLGLLNITTKMEDIEDESNAEFCQLETASKRINYLSKVLQIIHDDSENGIIEKITLLVDEQYSFEKSKLDTYGHDSSIGKCAQSRMHLIDTLKSRIKEL